MPSPAPNHATRWQVGLALLVAVFLVAMVASFTLAARRASPVVDADYYRHGLNYGKEQAARKAHAFTLEPRLAGAELVVEVRDPAGAPVTGGTLNFLRQAPGSTAALSLTETAPGLFRAPRPTGEGGTLRGTLSFSRGSAQASRKLVLVD